MSNPTVSVVMSVYIPESLQRYDDTIRYLHQAVESILQQTYTDFEYIIVNDGSSHHVASILNDYALRDKRISIIHQENCGLIASLNKGIHLARGIYIARMDADDISLPHRFEHQVTYLQTYPRVALYGSAIEFIDGNNAVLSHFFYPTTHAELRTKIMQSNYFAHSSIMMRASVFHEVGGYSSLYLHAEDYELWLRIAQHHNIANSEDVLLQYRVHENNVSWRNAEQQALSVIAAQLTHTYHRIITPEKDILLKNGVEKIHIEMSVMNIFIYWLRMVRRMGSHTEAESVINEVKRWSSNRTLERRIRAKLYREISLSYFSCASYIYGMAFFAKALFIRYK